MLRARRSGRLADPQSFYDTLATYPPYNTHLFHDVGAFQAGIGATLLFALFSRDALVHVLVGSSVGAGAACRVAHSSTRDLGGKSSDPILLSLLAAGLIAGDAPPRKRREETRRAVTR